jgi:uncharacterized protein YgbK (DUF1537 family)
LVRDSGRLVILADDFTGACDAAAAFAAWRSTLVVLGLPAQWPVEANEVEVLSVDLDLRERSLAEAEALTAEAARHLCSRNPQAGDVSVFLKIDSTLRGPIAGLVAGALTGSARQVAVIAPAFPEQGRLFHAGRLVMDGRQGASLTQVLSMDGTAVLGAHLARSDEEVEVAVDHARTHGVRQVVVDADAVECLQGVAHAWRRHAREWLLVGSAGLARQLAATSEYPATPANARSTSPRPPLRGSGPVLVVAGSPAPATQAQIELLGGLGPIVLVSPHKPPPPTPRGHNKLFVLCTTRATDRDTGECAQALADALPAWAAEFTSAALVLTGGATARLVCERLGARGVRLTGELEPGIPVGHLVGGVWDGVPVVTKAGAFGTPETLLDVVRALGVSSVAERTYD